MAGATVAQIGLLGRLALISTLGLGGVAADLVIKTALRLRICGIILGDGDRTYIREIIRRQTGFGQK